jgi:cytochrome c oxidase cbb3-type subunit 4
MFREIINSIPGINVLTIITTILFFLVFIGIVVWAVRAKKSYIKKMSELPFDSTIKDGE